jgi:hypothetical protein
VPQEVYIVDPKGLISKIPSEVFHYFEDGIAPLVKHDPDFEKCLKVSANFVTQKCKRNEKKKNYLAHNQP